MTSKAGTTKPGFPYEMKFTDGFGNLKVREVERPAVLSDFFLDSNKVDCHNQARQHDLALEEKWVTTDCWFRLATTIVGMNLTDAWKLADYHRIINWGRTEDNRMTVQRFAGVVGKQLIRNASMFSEENNLFAIPSSLSLPQGTQVTSTEASTSINLSTLSELTGAQERVLIPVRTLVDTNGQQHHQVQYPVVESKSGKKHTKTRACKNCIGKNEIKRHLTRFYCFTCGESASYCCPSGKPGERDCFLEHVRKIARKRKRDKVD
jgi:hypothetical protein